MATPVNLTASGTLKPTQGKFNGYQIIVNTAVGDINVRDGGASGTIRIVIPSGTQKGTAEIWPEFVWFTTDIYAEFNGGATGTVCFLIS